MFQSIKLDNISKKRQKTSSVCDKANINSVSCWYKRTDRERRYEKLAKETARDKVALPEMQPAILMQSGD